MIRKIKITESQYDRFLNLLLEANYDGIRYVETDDYLVFNIKTPKGVIKQTLKVVNVNIPNNEILCLSDNNEKIILRLNSFNQSTNELTFQKYDETTKKYITSKVKLENFNIYRDGDLFEPPILKPNTKQFDNSGQENMPDEKSKPIDLEIGTNTLPSNIRNIKENEILLIIKQDNTTIELTCVGVKKKNNNYVYIFLDVNGNTIEINNDDWDENKKILKLNTFNKNTNDYISKDILVKELKVFPQIDKTTMNKYYYEVLKNPNLEKAFYTAPSLWNYFVSALKNKKAEGTGIYPAIEIVNSFMTKKADEKLPGFTNKQNKTANFKFEEDFEIEYEDINGNKDYLKFNDQFKYKATVRPYKAGDGDNKILINNDEHFKLIVKEPTKKIEDEYFCDIYVNKRNTKQDKFGIKNIKVIFLDSDGYISNKNIR